MSFQAWKSAIPAHSPRLIEDRSGRCSAQRPPADKRKDSNWHDRCRKQAPPAHPCKQVDFCESRQQSAQDRKLQQGRKPVARRAIHPLRKKRVTDPPLRPQRERSEQPESNQAGEIPRETEPANAQSIDAEDHQHDPSPAPSVCQPAESQRSRADPGEPDELEQIARPGRQGKLRRQHVLQIDEQIEVVVIEQQSDECGPVDAGMRRRAGRGDHGRHTDARRI